MQITSLTDLPSKRAHVSVIKVSFLLEKKNPEQVEGRTREGGAAAVGAGSGCPGVGSCTGRSRAWGLCPPASHFLRRRRPPRDDLGRRWGSGQSMKLPGCLNSARRPGRVRHAGPGFLEPRRAAQPERPGPPQEVCQRVFVRRARGNCQSW